MVPVLATVAAFAALVAVAVLRRRGRGAAGLLPRFGAPPAGVKHLAATVSALSDLELHLPAGRPHGGKLRLGALLGLR